MIKNYRPIKKNTPRAKWAEELKVEKEKPGDFYKCKVIGK